MYPKVRVGSQRQTGLGRRRNFGSTKLAKFNLTPRYPHKYHFLSYPLSNAPINRIECFITKIDNFLPKLKVYKTRRFFCLSYTSATGHESSRNMRADTFAALRESLNFVMKNTCSGGADVAGMLEPKWLEMSNTIILKVHYTGDRKLY